MNAMVMHRSQRCATPGRSRLPTWRPIVPRAERLFAAGLAAALVGVLALLVEVGDSAAAITTLACPVPIDTPTAICPLPTSSSTDPE